MQAWRTRSSSTQSGEPLKSHRNSDLALAITFVVGTCELWIPSFLINWALRSLGVFRHNATSSNRSTPLNCRGLVESCWATPCTWNENDASSLVTETDLNTIKISQSFEHLILPWMCPTVLFCKFGLYDADTWWYLAFRVHLESIGYAESFFENNDPQSVILIFPLFVLTGLMAIHSSDDKSITNVDKLERLSSTFVS